MADILLVDMGNTRLKWVTANAHCIEEKSLGRGSIEEFVDAIQKQSDRPSHLLLSSVASKEGTGEFVGKCKKMLGITTTSIQSQKEFAGIKNGYSEPSTLGVDRWLAIIGAAHFHGMPVVVMDLGTATTLDAVDQTGCHLGGLILPGPALMLDSLSGGTAMQVPSRLMNADELSATRGQPGVAPAQSTGPAIQEGVFAAQVGALNQFMRHVSIKIDAEPKLVLTGGAAEGILERLEISPIFDPWLVFRGMLHHQEQRPGTD